MFDFQGTIRFVQVIWVFDCRNRPRKLRETERLQIHNWRFTFSTIGDVDRAVGESYNIPMHLGQFPTKSSFVIGPDNKVKYVYDWLFRPRRHVAKILAEISKVSGGQ